MATPRVGSTGVGTTKGDLYVVNALEELERVPVGLNTQVIVADSAQTLGLKWAGLFLPASFTNLATIAWLADISRLSWRRAMAVPRTGATVDFFGMTEASSGTRTTPALASTNIKTASKRTNYESGALANNGAGVVTAFVTGVGELWRGNAARLGGFVVYSQFSVDTTVATQRGYVGVSSQTSAANFATSTIEDQVNIVGVGWRNGDANLSIFHNDAAGTAARVDLGASFPAGAVADVYEVIIACEPNGSEVQYWVRRNRDDTLVASGTLAASLPATTQFLSVIGFINNGGTPSAADIEFMRWEVACP